MTQPSSSSSFLRLFSSLVQSGTNGLAKIPSTVKSLGLVSGFMNITSVVITVLTPLLIVSVFGADTRTMGLIEGVVYGTFHITKIFSGVISDFFRKRKILIVIGYGVSSLCMPIFALAPNVQWVFFGRFIERISNGLRDAPRDALISDVTPPHLTGTCYGFRQALASFGSFVGPFMITLFIWLFGNDYQKVFWIATIPAFIAVLICIFGIKDPENYQKKQDKANPLNFKDFNLLKSGYWKLVMVSALFMAARYSEGFLVLRAERLGIPLSQVPLILAMMNVAYFSTSIPVGSYSDRIDRRIFLGLGFICFIIANLLLANAQVFWHLIIGVMVWGLHMAMTQGVLLAIVANNVPSHLRGTGFGLFHLINGFGQLIGNSLFGHIWHHHDMVTAFQVSALIALLPLIVLYKLPSTKVPLEK